MSAPMQRASLVSKKISLVPVAIESQSDEFALAVEHRRPAVSTRDVVVCEEAQLHFACYFVRIRRVVGLAEQLVHYRFGIIVFHLVGTLHLCEKTLGCGVVARR